MKRIIALDLGDAWIGVAQTDLLQILCKPHTTWKASELARSLREYLSLNPVEGVVVGVPYTFAGTQSEQTKKIYAGSFSNSHSCGGLVLSYKIFL